MIDYTKLPKKKLVEHCEAYADAIHDMSIALLKSERENEQYKRRADELNRIRRFFHP